MPEGLDIEMSKDLNGTMAAYSEHLIVSTGQADWASKIENEKDTASWGELVAKVKQNLGPKGKFHDPYHNVVVSTSSFSLSPSSRTTGSAQALLFPSFKLVNQIETTDTVVDEFIHSFALPKALHASHDTLSSQERSDRTRLPAPSERWNDHIESISIPTIFICSHNSRDSRCGILGPLLHAEFCKHLKVRQPRLEPHGDSSPQTRSDVRYTAFNAGSANPAINVGMISHIGGHKWAGNVIVYIPPGYRGLPSLESPDGGEISPLAGKGIWYGRVEPKHVQGIVEETIGKGTVIRDLFRGGIDQNGSMIWM